ncbi:MAG: homoserine kinase [Phenylobacterium sp.]|jgi:homoserine kinase type II|uniref:homoserine kinase n=1 Tax=Phenylobacterium sp. TaxID=1871053 RepID=UPI002A36604E|nr:homoserine kinase [Phenylobacterium sp.]MDX9999002.1 homoserine kinase [Phenylobacterium sp.]
MAVYTDITDEELAQLLAEFDLGAPLSFKGVAEGVENSNFLLETEKGRYFLTVYERRVREDDLPFYLGLMRHLAEQGFPCATPIPNKAGQLIQRVRGKPAAVVSFLPGLSVRRPSAAHCREAGRGLAWLHEAGQGFPMSKPNDLGPQSWAPLFAGLRADAERLKPGMAAQIESDLDLLARGWPAGLPTGVIHADFFPDNVFFQAQMFAGAIDFYFACTDAYAYDIAIALNAWCFEPDGSFNITSARALVAGYESRRPLSAAERRALPILAHGAAMRFFLTRLHDWHATPPGALVRPKDPMEYERKLAVHRAAPDLVLFGEGA